MRTGTKSPLPSLGLRALCRTDVRVSPVRLVSACLPPALLHPPTRPFVCGIRAEATGPWLKPSRRTCRRRCDPIHTPPTCATLSPACCGGTLPCAPRENTVRAAVYTGVYGLRRVHAQLNALHCLDSYNWHEALLCVCSVSVLVEMHCAESLLSSPAVISHRLLMLIRSARTQVLPDRTQVFTCAFHWFVVQN